MHCAGHLSGARLGARHWFDSRGQMKPLSRPFLRQYAFLADRHAAVYDVAARCAPSVALRVTRNNKISRRTIKLVGWCQLATNGMLGEASKLVYSEHH